MLKWLSDSTKNLDLGSYVPQAVKDAVEKTGISDILNSAGNSPLQDAVSLGSLPKVSL